MTGESAPNALPLRVRPRSYCLSTELSEHEADRSPAQESKGVAVETFPILGQSAAAVEPADGLSERNRLFGFLHSIETGAASDGPGIRFVYFVSGCMFRCQYCHNPDTWRTKGGRKVTLEGALAEVEPYKKFLRFAGGVTVSGGEPMVQARFVGELLRRIKYIFGLHTALDTQGFLHLAVQDDWFEPIDLVLLDIKHSSPEAHFKLTGQPLQPTLDFAQRLRRLKKTIWLRYVLVPGLTDEERDIVRLADFAASLEGAVERVDVLPYHQMGIYKWKKLGIPYPLEDVPTPTTEAINHALQLFSSRGLKVNQ